MYLEDLRDIIDKAIEDNGNIKAYVYVDHGHDISEIFTWGVGYLDADGEEICAEYKHDPGVQKILVLEG